MSFDVFISYATQDKQVADAACATLEKSGIRCWVAPRDLRPGEEYGAGIAKAIDGCKALVLIFSSSANASAQIRREVERAVSRGAAILPIRIEDILPTDSLSYFVGSVHWMDAITPPLEDHLQHLAEVLKTLPFDSPAEKQWRSGATDDEKIVPRARDSARSFSRNGATITAFLLLLVVASGFGLVWKLSREQSPTTLQLSEANLLKSLEPFVNADNRLNQASEYPKAKLHRALVIAPVARVAVRTGGWSTQELAAERNIERCSQYFNEACAVVGADDIIYLPRADEGWPLKDAPRVHYSGIFNPERIPSLRESELLRPDIAAYATVAGPKSAAFHALGILVLKTNEPDQRSAEVSALAECNANPARSPATLDGPCYLYAVGNQVVLPLRLTMPMTVAAPK